jgi:adenylate kinase family enzyme
MKWLMKNQLFFLKGERMKIAVIGYSGSGKSTLAKKMHDVYQLPLLYLDTVQFENDWKERDRDEAVSMVRQFMAQSDWIIDGNYKSFLQEERMAAADKIVFMDFSRWNCLYRAVHRYFQYRNTSRESIASGCIEKIDAEFVWWILYQGRTGEKRQRYHKIMRKYPEKMTVIRNQKELDAFEEELFGRTE